MLDYNSLEQLRSHARIPDAIGVNDQDWAVAANTKARSFAAFHSIRPKEKAFSIQEIGEQ